MYKKSENMLPTNRRYDIDWLRVITIGLLLIYHTAIVFQPWGVFIGFIQNEKSMETIWIPMTMVNVWRIPLLFFVSGMGVCFAIRKRNWKQLLLERTQRIFLPFLFGVLLIVPIHVFIWQRYYHQDIDYFLGEGHLWFLKNIFIYIIILLPVFFYLRNNKTSIINKGLSFLFKNPIGLLLVIMSFVLEAVLVNPLNYEMYAMTWHGFFLGLIAFFFGFSFIQSGSTFWTIILKWKWLFLLLALSLYSIRFVLFELKSPNYLMAIESCVWIFTIFGFAHKYINKPNITLNYLSQAAYPIYIIHMIFLYLGSLLILPLNIPTFIKFILLTAFTFISCFGMYELIIRRIRFLRPLFGLKILRK